MVQTNQYALITGGTSGIGYELAKLLAADGYHLVLVAYHLLVEGWQIIDSPDLQMRINPAHYFHPAIWHFQLKI